MDSSPVISDLYFMALLNNVSIRLTAGYFIFWIVYKWFFRILYDETLSVLLVKWFHGLCIRKMAQCKLPVLGCFTNLGTLLRHWNTWEQNMADQMHTLYLSIPDPNVITMHASICYRTLITVIRFWPVTVSLEVLQIELYIFIKIGLQWLNSAINPPRSALNRGGVTIFPSSC